MILVWRLYRIQINLEIGKEKSTMRKGDRTANPCGRLSCVWEILKKYYICEEIREIKSKWKETGDFNNYFDFI